MRRAAWIACVAGVTAAAVFACSTFGSSGGSDRPDGEAGDALATDANPMPDAAPADAAGPFCASHPGATLCDDFDDPGNGLFSEVYVEDGGALGIDDSGAVSPPNALRITGVVPDNVACRFALEDALLDAAAPNGFHLEFKIFPHKLSGDTAIGPGVRLAAPGADRCEYYLQISPTSAKLREEHDDASTYTPLDRKVIVGQWNRVSIDVEGAGAARTVRVTIDDVSSPAYPVDSICQSADRVAVVLLGLFCLPSPSETDVAWDDVLVTVR